MGMEDLKPGMELTGTVRNVIDFGAFVDMKAAVGASVKAGDVLCILEAMKMENEIVAPQDGTVASVNCRKGDVVNVGDLLVSLN